MSRRWTRVLVLQPLSDKRKGDVAIRCFVTLHRVFDLHFLENRVHDVRLRDDHFQARQGTIATCDVRPFTFGYRIYKFRRFGCRMKGPSKSLSSWKFSVSIDTIYSLVFPSIFTYFTSFCPSSRSAHRTILYFPLFLRGR